MTSPSSVPGSTTGEQQPQPGTPKSEGLARHPGNQARGRQGYLAHNKLRNRAGGPGSKAEKTADVSSDDENRGNICSRIHIIFSTSCSDLQDWQAYLFFYQVMKTKQTGNVTRLIAGCTPEQKERQRNVLQHIQTAMSPRFNIFFIEQDYGKVFSLRPGDYDQYKYLNKPFGTRDFFENVLDYPHSHEHDDDLIVLMDPDMLLMRPFVNDFSDMVPETQVIKSVRHGHMLTQPFNMGHGWYDRISKANLTMIFKADTSAAYNMSGNDVEEHNGGPPYMGTGKDFYNLVKTWCEILPRYHQVDPDFQVEMYSTVLAAAHLSLEWHLVPNFMISHHRGVNEGWSAIDSAKPENLCMPLPVKDRPLVFHYCQRFGLGEYFFTKHIFAMQFSFFSCEEKLLKEPPQNVALLYNYTHNGDGTNSTWSHEYNDVKRNALMLCTMTSVMNEAATFYKKHQCGSEAN